MALAELGRSFLPLTALDIFFMTEDESVVDNWKLIQPIHPQPAATGGLNAPTPPPGDDSGVRIRGVSPWGNGPNLKTSPVGATDLSWF